MAMAGEEGGASLPFQATHPHDTLRKGLTSFKQEALPLHPVQTHLAAVDNYHRKTRRQLTETALGSAHSLRMDIDKQILSRFQRPSGLLQSSMLGLQSLTGELDEFCFEDYLNLPQDSESMFTVDMHAAMEARLGISRSPAARTLL